MGVPCPASFSNSPLARILMNIAPTPIGPKWPQKMASRHVRMSGMMGFMANMMGIRRKQRMRSAMHTRRQGTMVRSGEFILLHGMMAP